MKQLSIIISIAFLGFALPVQAQSYKLGSSYDTNRDDYTDFKFLRSYSEEGSVYVTTYKLFHPTKGHHFQSVTITHYKTKGAINIKVEETGGGLFAMDKEYNIDAEDSSGKFGKRGTIAALGGKRVPNEYMVSYVSSKRENLKVHHINATFSGDSNFFFYVLDK